MTELLRQATHIASNANHIEDELGLGIDAVLHKLTQETAEVIAAVREHEHNPGPEAQLDVAAELGDMYFNFLSIGYRLCGSSLHEYAPLLSVCKTITLDNESDRKYGLVISLGDLNDSIQKVRGIYCKKRATDLSAVLEASESFDLATHILALHHGLGVTDVVTQAGATLEKFRTRKELYRINMQE